jgi:hypothetical protein
MRLAAYAIAVAMLVGCAQWQPDVQLPTYVATSPIRTIAEIQYTFQKSEPDFKELWKSAGFRDKKSAAFVVGLTVAPDGSVAECHVVVSTFNSELTQALLDKVRGLNFGARNVPPYTVADYPIQYISE